MSDGGGLEPSDDGFRPDRVRRFVSDDIYATAELRTGAPKDVFPAGSMDARRAYALVHDELMLDGVARMNLATFCTTWAEPEVRALMAESLDKNIVDKDEYPQTAELERRCVRMLADLWHAPDPASATGTSTTGSSEAAMLAGLAAKFRWRELRTDQGEPAERPNFVCGPVQVCWEKFARYFDVEIRQVRLDGDRYAMTTEDVAALCDENTIMVVATLGQTFTGLYEDVNGISSALDRLQEETGLDVPVHVDAASGGFLAPFAAPDLVWDFRLRRVKSVNASGHKAGLAPLGSGWALWREAADLPADLVFNVDYLGGDMPTFNLNFSRPGGQVIAQYYDFIRLGREGYAAVQLAVYEVAHRFAAGVAALGPFELIFDGDPERGITAVSWRLAPGRDLGFNLYDFGLRLRSHGWLIAAYPLPAGRQDEVIQRAVIRHGFSHDMADVLLADMRRCLDQLATHPPSVSLSRSEAGSFGHDATPARP
jgi:glutamate decarboxylase